MRDRVLRFVEELRGHDLPVSVAESMDAIAAVAAAGVEREVLREALAATLVKDEHDRSTFDECFERAFPLGTPPRGTRRAARSPAAGTGGAPRGPGGGAGAGPPGGPTSRRPGGRPARTTHASGARRQRAIARPPPRARPPRGGSMTRGPRVHARRGAAGSFDVRCMRSIPARWRRLVTS